MKHFFLIILCFSFHGLSAQVFDTEAIKSSGDDAKRLNLVILSEGYTASQLEQFKTDAISFTTSMFRQSPFKEYANYFNVHIVKVPSNESGADHPAISHDPVETTANPIIPIKNVDTYFNATYDSFGVHRLLYYEIDEYSANGSHAKIQNVLATNFPTYDQALILVNSLEYGGSGGDFPMTYNGYYAVDVILHELGHSFADLKDEYYPIDDVLAKEGINMTLETNPTLVKWKNWLGINGIGIYQYFDANNIAKNWYKPRHQECKMEIINKPFCSVCKEGIVEKIHSILSPIDSYTPISNAITSPTFPLDFQLNLIKPNPNTLKTLWTLNGQEFADNVDMIAVQDNDFVTGMNAITVAVTDATTLLKIDNHDAFHVYTVTWTIDNTSLGVKDITSEVANLNIVMFPNPTNTIINFKVESDSDTNLKVAILGLDGKLIKSVYIGNYQTNQIDISDLRSGLYLANFYSNNVLLATKKLVVN